MGLEFLIGTGLIPGLDAAAGMSPEDMLGMGIEGGGEEFALGGEGGEDMLLDPSAPQDAPGSTISPARAPRAALGDIASGFGDWRARNAIRDLLKQRIGRDPRSPLTVEVDGIRFQEGAGGEPEPLQRVVTEGTKIRGESPLLDLTDEQALALSAKARKALQEGRAREEAEFPDEDLALLLSQADASDPAARLSATLALSSAKRRKEEEKKSEARRREDAALDIRRELLRSQLEFRREKLRQDTEAKRETARSKAAEEDKKSLVAEIRRKNAQDKESARIKYGDDPEKKAEAIERINERMEDDLARVEAGEVPEVRALYRTKTKGVEAQAPQVAPQAARRGPPTLKPPQATGIVMGAGLDDATVDAAVRTITDRAKFAEFIEDAEQAISGRAGGGFPMRSLPPNFAKKYGQRLGELYRKMRQRIEDIQASGSGKLDREAIARAFTNRLAQRYAAFWAE